MSKPAKHGKKWQIRWYDETGKRQSEVHADFKDAEYALKLHQTEVEEIRRGFRVRPPKDRTFKELCAKWMEVRASRKRNPAFDECIIRVHLIPAFGVLSLRQITAERIAEFSADLMARRAPQTVKNILSLLNAMFNQSVEWGWLPSAPRIRKPKIRLFSAGYRWLQNEEEIKRFLAAAREEDENRVFYKSAGWCQTVKVGPMYATAVYTGMRAGELAGLRWGDVDLERRLIAVQRSFNGPTKAGDIRHVPILDVLLPIIKSWKLESGGKGLVFPNSAGEMWDQCGRIFAEFLKRTLIRGGFDPRYVHFHGLRHSFASHWVLRGGDLFRLQKILGHKDSAVTQRYAHLMPSAFQNDWARFGKAEEPTTGEVVNLVQEEKRI